MEYQELVASCKNNFIDGFRSSGINMQENLWELHRRQMTEMYKKALRVEKRNPCEGIARVICDNVTADVFGKSIAGQHQHASDMSDASFVTQLSQDMESNGQFGERIDEIRSAIRFCIRHAGYKLNKWQSHVQLRDIVHAVNSLESFQRDSLAAEIWELPSIVAFPLAVLEIDDETKTNFKEAFPERTGIRNALETYAQIIWRILPDPETGSDDE
jgi:hypothetical protein